MLQKEFEERTGIKVTPEQFEDVNKVYMVTSMNKDEFCTDWEKHHLDDSDVVRDLYQNLVNFRSAFEILKQQNDSLAVFLIEQAQQYSSVKCRNRAISMLGKRAYLAYKMEHDMKLWEDEKVMVIEILKKK